MYISKFLDCGQYRLCTVEVSGCGWYRYRLVREWDDRPRVVWVMLNPSTADSVRDDPTIRRCVGFSRRWGCGSLEVVNLYALRATDPRWLKVAPDPVGPENRGILSRLEARDDQVVVAWGSRVASTPMAGELIATVSHSVRQAWCLGLTKSGQPRHPLMLSYDAKRIKWEPKL